MNNPMIIKNNDDNNNIYNFNNNKNNNNIINNDMIQSPKQKIKNQEENLNGPNFTPVSAIFNMNDKSQISNKNSETLQEIEQILVGGDLFSKKIQHQNENQGNVKSCRNFEKIEKIDNCYRNQENLEVYKKLKQLDLNQIYKSEKGGFNNQKFENVSKQNYNQYQSQNQNYDRNFSKRFSLAPQNQNFEKCFENNNQCISLKSPKLESQQLYGNSQNQNNLNYKQVIDDQNLDQFDKDFECDNDSLNDRAENSVYSIIQNEDRFSSNFSYCVNHPVKQAKYKLVKNNQDKFCSKCAINYALKGEQIQELLSNNEKFRKQKTDVFMQKLKKVYKDCENRIIRLDESQILAQNLFQTEIDKVLNLYLSLEKIMNDQKQILIKNIELKKFDCLKQIRKDQQNQKDHILEMQKFNFDIKKNYENIIREMENDPFNDIIRQYEYKIEHIQQQIFELDNKKINIIQIDQNQIDSYESFVQKNALNLNYISKFILEKEVKKESVNKKVHVKNLDFQNQYENFKYNNMYSLTTKNSENYNNNSGYLLFENKFDNNKDVYEINNNIFRDNIQNDQESKFNSNDNSNNDKQQQLNFKTEPNVDEQEESELYKKQIQDVFYDKKQEVNFEKNFKNQLKVQKTGKKKVSHFRGGSSDNAYILLNGHKNQMKNFKQNEQKIQLQNKNQNQYPQNNYQEQLKNCDNKQGIFFNEQKSGKNSKNESLKDNKKIFNNKEKLTEISSKIKDKIENINSNLNINCQTEIDEKPEKNYENSINKRMKTEELQLKINDFSPPLNKQIKNENNKDNDQIQFNKIEDNVQNELIQNLQNQNSNILKNSEIIQDNKEQKNHSEKSGQINQQQQNLMGQKRPSSLQNLPVNNNKISLENQFNKENYDNLQKQSQQKSIQHKQKVFFLNLEGNNMEIEKNQAMGKNGLVNSIINTNNTTGISESNFHQSFNSYSQKNNARHIKQQSAFIYTSPNNSSGYQNQFQISSHNQNLFNQNSKNLNSNNNINSNNISYNYNSNNSQHSNNSINNNNNQYTSCTNLKKQGNKNTYLSNNTTNSGIQQNIENLSKSQKTNRKQLNNINNINNNNNYNSIIKQKTVPQVNIDFRKY
ncbi:hypothetical protein PPERSA_07551 [Pseudocohnilembus persalinus]|uniref:Uncharacterized protein n=1 Tax=Pseudocohnilembus persalinus TaxID=266149 RepID=A0A0V0QZT4_PSEPJ|nr:hypothetical protein PPERSA_07551 [Pseudocohnilembus persalinus]|eukprot:KRX07801.1 hypothetical protein PPERSA_07551 [Pseudocohnilembus persalinus]